jgi:hypothetical protein
LIPFLSRKGIPSLPRVGEIRERGIRGYKTMMLYISFLSLEGRGLR